MQGTSRSIRRHDNPRERGQSLTEFTFVLPILALILVGLAEFGFLLNDQAALVNAARAGARAAALDGAASLTLQSDIQTAVLDEANGPSGNPFARSSLVQCPIDSTTGITVTQNPPTSGSNTVGSWTVQVSCTYQSVAFLDNILPLVHGNPLGTIRITQSSTMRDTFCNRPDCVP